MKKIILYFLLAILLVLFFIACNKKQTRFPGFSERENGLYYKLLAIGDIKRNPVKGQYLQVKMTFRTEQDSVFFSTYDMDATGTTILYFQEPSFKGSFEEMFAEMCEEDSISFIVNADSLFHKFFKRKLPPFIKENAFCKVDIKLNKILDEAAYQKELVLAKERFENSDIEEHRILKEYARNQSNILFLNQGLYCVPIKEGKGAIATPGKTVVIAYKGSFLNGKEFDSTYGREPMEFTLGEKDQVIQGLEFGIKTMKEGGKAKFIIPSHLAFGGGGSSTGIIPPYTSVVYEVDLLAVK